MTVHVPPNARAVAEKARGVIAKIRPGAGSALREAAIAVRKAGTPAIVGVYGVIDKFPLGVLMNKGITIRTAQQPGQRYMPRMLEHVQRGELDPSFLVTHRMPLEEAPRDYEMFKTKEDGCLRAVSTP